jgi:hypothetical protein
MTRRIAGNPAWASVIRVNRGHHHGIEVFISVKSFSPVPSAYA